MNLQKISNLVQHLQCPSSGQALDLMTIADATSAMGFAPVSLRTNGTEKASPIGATAEVLVCANRQTAYPVVDGVPILLAPEALGDESKAGPFDLTNPAFEEAYLEMDFYNEVGTSEANNIVGSEAWQIVEDLVRLSNGNTQEFLEPPEAWLDAVFDSAAQDDAYRALEPVQGRRLAQVGGKGIHAVKFLLAGAEEAWIITPMLGEIRCAFALAEHFGVADRLRAVVSVAEQLGLVDSLFDGIFVGGSVHHMQTALAMPELYRSLTAGSALGAVEPFRAPLYGVGTRILGKREANAHCTPMNAERIAPFLSTFSDGVVTHHGALSRYPMLALWKAGLSAPFNIAWKTNRFDDAISDRIPGLRAAGSSISMVGRRSQ